MDLKNVLAVFLFYRYYKKFSLKIYFVIKM